MNIEIPKKFKPLINNAYQVAQSTLRPISRKYDLKEPAYPVELDTLADLFEGISEAKTISFAGADGAWDDPANVAYIEELSEYIAPDIGGKPFTVLLLDPNLYEQKRCTLIDTWQCTPTG